MASTEPFEQRVKRIAKKHQRIETSGATPKLGKDGLIVMRPRRAGLRFPVKPFVMLLVLAFAFKVFLFNYLGDQDYAARLSALDSEVMVERAGAFILQPDPATLWITEMIGRFLG
ncbi:hypothetical protein [Roseisalinus antarcticus]|uniref:Uncharacterized protein n=1 Tax=Roseisalinus antarcticus TaxID=254357 RepID=A0A1Y5SXQ3_9RHOB|nr:hypothetical protein [Roseisalinus antarcticus]SLN51093.1 hypothetical protein ROA7023_02232 [Roseisalinus antarcticus]